MTMGQVQPELFYCPRCGGLMQKLAGSMFYWHAESNHRPCLITNIADPKVLKTRSTGSDYPDSPATGPTTRP